MKRSSRRQTEALLQLDLQRWRMRLVISMLFLGFGVLTVRAAYLQGYKNEFLNDEGDKRINRVLPIPAHRGMILDRRGEVLAISTPVESLWLNPKEAVAKPEQIQALASHLRSDPDDLSKIFSDKSKTFVYIKRLMPPDVAQNCLDLGIKGLYNTPEYRRYYPAGEVASQILGMTNIEDVGQEGLEFSYNTWLSGEPGMKRVVRDRKGNVVEEVDRLRLPKPGSDLHLSINMQIQYLAYRELAASVERNQARAGSIVVLDAHTGEILALANVPAYNPNNRATLKPERSRNRAATDTYEPGSTMKPFLYAAALDAGVVKPDSRFDTGPGYLEIAGKRIRDVHPKGVLTIAEALQVSSNVVAAEIALEMKSEDYWKVLNKAGFGTPPASGLPGETGGRLRPYDTWRPIEKATMAFGHGLSVSLLQLAHAYTAFANDGVMPPLTILKRQEKPLGQRVMSERTAESLLAILETVTQEGGTAPMARVSGYRVAGKTGTAHKLDGGRYAPNKYISSFVGLAPVSNPRLVIAVMVDEPGGREYYGGLVAGPIFSKVMAGTLRLMALPPDAPMEAVNPPVTTIPELAEAV